MNVNPDRFAARVASLLLALASSWLALGVCRADVPTPAQECRLRNAAICELNGVRFMVDGPCPPAARTIRPPGNEPCEEIAPSTTRIVQLPTATMVPGQMPALQGVVPPATAGAVPTAPVRRDLAWVGQAERWLLPLLLLGGGLLLAGLCLFLVFRRRAVRKDRPPPEVADGVTRPLLQLLVAAACAVPLGYQAAALAFQWVFSRADNHDTALPVLLAAPVAAVVFLLVTGLSFALIGLLLAWLFKGQGKVPRK
ncbi:MAG: hypothetical protein AW10_02463 [Candidatus Accumulibacter appositus]|uniref:Uncharacterized protein n=1 Tax=Candidatus Accumulibacter appositus TaxID=1454003 RepID=A0A011QJZ5_9PROT|nr:hypothetical protein [Accumulibacter sp.]EXI79189.1 MAG: hypothetical protein AW10_02463 [Candidatus Accumulibacter appositus]HRF04226.1 hypothetical protein [Accumulibacter sp.]